MAKITALGIKSIELVSQEEIFQYYKRLKVAIEQDPSKIAEGTIKRIEALSNILDQGTLNAYGITVTSQVNSILIENHEEIMDNYESLRTTEISELCTDDQQTLARIQQILEC